MIAKFNKYLLENYPILWNLRVPHLIIILVPTILVFFLFGFLLCDPSSTGHWITSTLSTSFYFLFSIAILGSMVMYILWLVNYNGNNSVDSFYPRTSLSVYLEWLGILLITFLFICIPFSMWCGVGLRLSVHNYGYSKTDVQTVIMGNMLLPSSTSSYTLDYDNKALTITPQTDIHSIPAKYLENTENGVEYTGPSLLYYNGYSSYSSDEEMRVATQKMKTMLENKDTEGIRTVMRNYLDFCRKYDVSYDISVNTWFSMMYNPPLYPVNNENLINNFNENYYTSSSDDDEEKSEEQTDSIQTTNIQIYSTQEEVGDRPSVDKSSVEYYFYEGYKENSFLFNWFEFILYSSVALSLYVFAYRFSKGNSILFAFVSIFVIWFVYGIVATFFEIFMHLNNVFYIFLLLGPIIVVWIMLIYRTVNNLPKQRSRVYFHLGIWFVPAIIPIILLFFIHLLDNINFERIFLANILFVLIVMYPISFFSLRWKALPED